MNIVNRLTLRHMRLNKKRTIVTIIGIVISVAMLTSISVVVNSYNDFMIRKTEDEKGKFHVKYENYYYKDHDKILEGLDVKEYAIGKNLGDYVYEADFEGGINACPYNPFEAQIGEENSKDVIRIMAVSDNYFDMMADEIKGELPSNDREIIYSPIWAMEELKVGDKIELGNKEYTISGIMHSKDFEYHDIELPNANAKIFYTKLNESALEKDDIVNGCFYLNEIDSNFEKKVNSVEEALAESNVIVNTLVGDKDTWYCEGTYKSINYSVLKYYGISQNNSTDVSAQVFKLVLTSTVIAGSVALIANGFGISISERSKYIGMLASVGATKKQKRNTVYFEGFIEGVIAIPIGLLASIIIMSCVFKPIEPLIQEVMNTNQEFYVVLDIEVVVWTVILSVVTILISAYIPAKRASLISPIDAIRQNRDFKCTNKTIKTWKITRKIFCFEGELALKNLKRNKKRYMVTVWSMFISLTLFIIVYGLIHFEKEEILQSMEDIGYDFVIHNLYEEGEEKGEPHTQVFNEVTDKLISEDGLIDEYHRWTEVFVYLADYEMRIDKNYYSDKYLEYLKVCGVKNRSDENSLKIVLMQEEDMRKYLRDNDIDYEDFVSKKDNVILIDYIREENAIGNNNVVYSGSRYNEDFKNITLNYTIKDFENYKEIVGEYKCQFNIYTKSSHLLGKESEADVVTVLITPEKFEEMKSQPWGISLINNFYAQSDNVKEVKNIYEKALKNVSVHEESFYFKDYTEEIEEAKNTILLVEIFVYGFIMLISLICVANIVNTISISVALRKREFAMLKSVGMTDRAFTKMIAYETAFYGINTLLYGLPIASSIILTIMVIMNTELGCNYTFPWMSYVIAIVGVFSIIGITMLYSVRKVRKENIIDALKNELV